MAATTLRSLTSAWAIARSKALQGLDRPARRLQADLIVSRAVRRSAPMPLTPVIIATRAASSSASPFIFNNRHLAHSFASATSAPVKRLLTTRSASTVQARVNRLMACVSLRLAGSVCGTIKMRLTYLLPVRRRHAILEFGRAGKVPFGPGAFFGISRSGKWSLRQDRQAISADSLPGQRGRVARLSQFRSMTQFRNRGFRRPTAPTALRRRKRTHARFVPSPAREISSPIRTCAPFVEACRVPDSRGDQPGRFKSSLPVMAASQRICRADQGLAWVQGYRNWGTTTAATRVCWEPSPLHRCRACSTTCACKPAGWLPLQRCKRCPSRFAPPGRFA